VDGTHEDKADFTDEFCAFLQASVTSVDSAELLLALWHDRETPLSPAALAARLGPGASLSPAETERHINHLQQRGLVRREPDGRARYVSAPEHEGQVQRLARLYNERPVTLFRVIHALRDDKIKTLADAFRIWGK
jgi:DNA-binding MarR family transcriptional regulator